MIKPTSQQGTPSKIDGLEIFDVEIDTLKQDSIKSRIKYTDKVAGEYIVRYTCTTIPSDIQLAKNTLITFLDNFDTHLEQTAESVGATVVDHTWGLVNRESKYGFYYNPELSTFGIEDYLLAARVKILPGTKISTKHGAFYDSLEQSLQSTRIEQLARQGWTSDAVRANQFTASKQDGQLQLILHDIEPRILGYTSITSVLS